MSAGDWSIDKSVFSATQSSLVPVPICAVLTEFTVLQIFGFTM